MVHRETDQVHVGLVLEGTNKRNDVVMALQVVHDLDLPPHILHILL